MSQELQRVEPPEGKLPAERSIRLDQQSVLDLSGLSDSEVAELKKQYNSGMIDIHKKAAELKVDVGALDAALGSFTDQTAKATQAGAHATITHSQTSALGRTEVVIGNTDRAAAGKLSASAAGLQDKTLWIVGIVAIAAIIVAMILVGHH